MTYQTVEIRNRVLEGGKENKVPIHSTDFLMVFLDSSYVFKHKYAYVQHSSSV